MRVWLYHDYILVVGIHIVHLLLHCLSEGNQHVVLHYLSEGREIHCLLLYLKSCPHISIGVTHSEDLGHVGLGVVVSLLLDIAIHSVVSPSNSSI